MPRKYTPIVELQAYKMREIDKVPIPDIMRITGIESESGTYAIINRVKSELQASRTLRAYMNVSISTEADIAVALDSPEEVVEHHLREPVIPHQKLYALIFPEDYEYDYNSIQSLWELEAKIERNVIQTDTDDEAPPIEDGKSHYASKEVSEALQGPDPLKKIAEHLGALPVLDNILAAINENEACAQNLESAKENLKQVASYLGVPNTVQHIKQRIDKIKTERTAAFDKGYSAGKEKQLLEKRREKLRKRQAKLDKETAQLQDEYNDLEQTIATLRKEI